jgi:hypothetical protein
MTPSTIPGAAVAMDDALLMRRAQGVGERLRDLQNAVDGHRLFRNDPVERPARDEFHRQKVDAAGLLDGVHGDDVGVIQRRKGARLAAEPLQAMARASASCAPTTAI